MEGEGEGEEGREGERDKVQADVCIHSVGGSRLFAEDGGRDKRRVEREQGRVSERERESKGRE